MKNAHRNSAARAVAYLAGVLLPGALGCGGPSPGWFWQFSHLQELPQFTPACVVSRFSTPLTTSLRSVLYLSWLELQLFQYAASIKEPKYAATGHDELCLPYENCMLIHVAVLHLEAFTVLFLASGLLAVAAPLMLSDRAILGLHIAGHLCFKGLQERRAWWRSLN